MKHKTTWNDMPSCECPCCGKKWQISDWYELNENDLVECPFCNEPLEVLCRDVSVSMEFAAAKDAICAECGKMRANSTLGWDRLSGMHFICAAKAREATA